MSTVKGASLRRRQRHVDTPSVSQGCDAPISLVFRTHSDALSKAAFLFCPKNFNLANPTPAANTGNSATTANAAFQNSPSGGVVRPSAGANAHSTSGSSPGNPKRFAASTSPTSTAAGAAPLPSPSPSAESVQTLVEAIVELRPFFSAPLFSSGNAVSHAAPASGNPATASSSHPNPSSAFHSNVARPVSSASLAWGSYVDLMSLSSFASPSGGSGGGSGAVTNGSFNGGGTAASAGTSRYGEPPHGPGSPHAAGPTGGGQDFPAPTSPAAGGANVTHSGGQHVLGSASLNNSAGGGGGLSASCGASAQGVGGSGGAGVAGPPHSSGGATINSLMHPSGGWICRAMAFNEKEVSHANGAISVNQSLTSKCPLINEVAKGKIMARILSSYRDVQDHYGLSHVEVTVEGQYVSRSDLFLISEALRERILYEGEEIHICNFRIRVREMLQAVVNAFAPLSSSPASPISTPTVSGGPGTSASPASGATHAANSNAAAAAANGTGATTSYVRVGCGIVLPTTHINFQSLSPVHYIVVELSREMWNTTVDGRIALTWAIRKFISELLLRQLPKRKASPLIRVVFTGRLQKEFQFSRQSDVFHLLELPREARNVDVVEEIRMHCEALVDRVLREVQTAAYRLLEAEVAAYREGRAGRGGGELPRGGGGTGPLMEADSGVSGFPKGTWTSPTKTPADGSFAFEMYVRHRQAYIEGITAKRLFVHAKQSNTLEALSVLLERCDHHYIDRHLTLCGHAVTVVSAGKGFYRVTNSLVQVVCARLHDMGLEKVMVVCIGRPPLHVTPLLEYTSDDDTLRSQYHLHSSLLSRTGASGSGACASAEVERYYETPEWISVLFFYSALHNSSGEAVFELLPKESWQREYQMMSIVDTMWSPQEPPPPQQQQKSLPHAGGGFAGGAGRSPLSTAQAGSGRSGDGMEGGEDGCYGSAAAGSGSGARQRGGLGEPALGPGGCADGGTTTSGISMAAAANPPLLIPGLGLRFYAAADVILPVTSAAAAFASLPEDSVNPKSAAGAAAARMPTPHSYLSDALEVGISVNGGADVTASSRSPLSHNAHFGPRRSPSGAAGRVSPIFAVGGAASSPLLVRTTTASSSAFASPNVPARGSMPRGGPFHTAAVWQEHHHLSHGASGSCHSSQQHIAYPPHPAIVSAFPPLQPSSVSPRRQSVGGGPRKGEATVWGSTKRRLRGSSAAAARTPLHMSSSSIAISAAGPSSGSRSHASHPSSLTSYSVSSHPQLHVSRSFDKTTANPASHFLGAFERSVRSAGSSYVGRHHSSSHRQPLSLLCRESNVGKSSINSIFGPPAASAAVTSAVTAALYELSTGLPPLEGGGASRPIAVCSWYCLHTAKLHQEDGNAFPATNAASRAEGLGLACTVPRGGPTGSADVSLGEEPIGTTLAAAAAAAELEPSPHPGVAMPSAPWPAKPWHRPLTRTRTDAAFCGCNVVDSDLRNGYLILEITLDTAMLPGCFWSPRLILDDQCWCDFMSCFTGRDDRLTRDADSDDYTDAETESGDSMTVDGVSSVDGYFNAASGAPASTSSLRADELLGRGNGGAAAPNGGGGGPKAVRSTASAISEVYRFQSDFRAAEVFCRSHSGISADGLTLIIPTHNNGVHFQSSEKILLRLQPNLFVTAVDEGGDAAVERRGPVSPASLHGARDGLAGEGEGGGAEVAAEADEDRGASTTTMEDHGEPETAQKADAATHATAAAAAIDNERWGGQDVLRTSPNAKDACGAGSVDGGSRLDNKGRVMPTLTTSSGYPLAVAAATPREACGGSHTGGETADSRQKLSDAVATATKSPRAASASGPGGGAGGTSLDPQLVITAGPIAAAAITTSIQPVPPRLLTASGVVRTSPSAVPADAPQDHSLLSPEKNYGERQHNSAQVPCSPCNITYPPSAVIPVEPGAVITVGYVQLRNSLLFAIKPINPLRPGTEEELREDVTALSQSAESASTATVLRRRWQWKHPDIASELPHLASWTRLCTCRLLPLYGSKPAYPREGFYTVSPHQYTVTNTSAAGGHADPASEKKRLLEFVLQRLQQQYQIVVDGPGLAAGTQWPRADPSPNARLEMSLGHQTHTLKVGETAKTISITRMLHRGMYSNGQVTHMLSYRYLLWNYLADEFSTREVHMEAQIGERNAFRWESLDRWLQERPEAHIPRAPDLWLRSREVSVMLLPEDPAHPPSFEEFHRFIGYRFSAHLSTHGKVEWQRHSSGVSIEIPDSMPLTFPSAPPLMDVVLVHDNSLTLDTRNVVDPVTGRTVVFDVPLEERYMSVDVSLPRQYDAQCCYFLRVSWLVCAASFVVDWFGSFIANASRFHFHAVPVACYYNSPKSESLTPHYDVVASSLEEEPVLRRVFAELLISPAYRYYPDTATITRNCRLVHITGLCCVILPPSATLVAQWYQNACLRQGSVEQLELLLHFKQAEALARKRVAAILGGVHT
ncbi:hypothetical protein ABL78_2990 [Leptomonas seymouri]|uniref:Vacuolar membrane-associated protein Iml1 N-terminal domain-containing protein n=1 Tax=Leptomonas seymouri TaxID=5684 RepID=A0A0N1PCF3_LEPSE|nr:hypothetical protein ABL78_2990 [Leptomonas seymouri]|eukprot:KPI87912.1 hypothetical protein ABL78_2990 [Leptomonas seymouri]